MPLHDGDLQGHVHLDGLHVLSYARGRLAAVDSATGATLWSVVEADAVNGYALTGGQGVACVAWTRSTGGRLQCHSSATGDPVWGADLEAVPYRATWDDGPVLGFADGRVAKWTPQGQAAWSAPSLPTSAGIHALAAGGGRIFAAVLHGTIDSSPPLGRHPADVVRVLDGSGGDVATWSLPDTAEGPAAPYSLAFGDGVLTVGRNDGWLARLGEQGQTLATAKASHGLAITALALQTGQVAAASLRGAITLHDASLAPIWTQPRATDAGHAIGVAFDSGLIVSAHRSGVLASGPMTPAASVLLHAPAAATLWAGDVGAEVAVARQGPAAQVPLRLRWVAADGSLHDAWSGSLNVLPQAQSHRVQASTAAIPDGVYRLQATLADPLGERSTRSAPVIVDRTGPQIVTVEPRDGSKSSSALVTVRSTWVDATSGVDTARLALTIDGEPVAVTREGGQVRTAAPLELADGRHTAHATAVDRAGNPSTRTWAFTVDAAPPRILEPHVALTGANYLSVSWTTNEPARCAASTTGPGTPSTLAPLTDRHQAFLAPLRPDETYDVDVSCVDEAGQAAQGVRMSARTKPGSAAAPALDVRVEPTEALTGWAQRPATLTVASGAPEVLLSVDGGPFAAFTSPMQVPEGSVLLRVVALAGDAARAWEARVQSDSFPPTAPTVTAPAAAGGPFAVQWTGASDGDAPLARLVVQVLDGPRWRELAALEPALGRGLVSPVAGNATYRLVAIDRAGHENASTPFTVAGPLAVDAGLTLHSPASVAIGRPVVLEVGASGGVEPVARLLQEGREVGRVPHPDAVGAGRWLFTIPTGAMRPGELVIQVLSGDAEPRSVTVLLTSSASAGTTTVDVDVQDSPSAAPALLLTALLAACLARRRAS